MAKFKDENASNLWLVLAAIGQYYYNPWVSEYMKFNLLVNLLNLFSLWSGMKINVWGWRNKCSLGWYKAVDAPGKNQYHLPTDFSIAGMVRAVCWLQVLSSSQHPLQIYSSSSWIEVNSSSTSLLLLVGGHRRLRVAKRIYVYCLAYFVEKEYIRGKVIIVVFFCFWFFYLKKHRLLLWCEQNSYWLSNYWRRAIRVLGVIIF